MAYRCLADFLEDLGQAGELARVDAEVDPDLEIAEISHRTAARGGAALLFGRVARHDVPVVTNLLATEARIRRALGVSDLAHVAERLAALVEPAEPEGWLERLRPGLGAAAAGGLAPRTVRTGPCQQVVRLQSDVDLGRLPLLKSAPGEAGRSATAAVAVVADPDRPRQWAGRSDLQLVGRDRLAALWGDHAEPARLLAEYRRRGEKMPVAAFFGGDPAVLLAACSPLGPGADALALAGLLREKPLDVVSCRTSALSVPAEAEIVVEGYVDPTEPPAEAGPLSMPTGRYGRPRPAPVVSITAVTHRANPVLPAMVPGSPPNELSAIHRALQPIMLPLLRLAIPELVDYELPEFGSARHVAAVAIRKTYAGQARQVASAAWGLPSFMFAKILVIVDEEVDVHDPAAVLAAAACARPGRDTILGEGPPDPWDPSQPPGELGRRMAIDATARLCGEQAVWPERAAMDDAVRGMVDQRWAEYGLGPG